MVYTNQVTLFLFYIIHKVTIAIFSAVILFVGKKKWAKTRQSSVKDTQSRKKRMKDKGDFKKKAH